MTKGLEETSAAAEPRVMRLEPCASLWEACGGLAAAVEGAGTGCEDERLVRLEQPLTGPLDPLTWLRAAPPPRFYWGPRDGAGSPIVAGAGVAEEVRGDDFAIVSRAAKTEGATGLSYLLTARFDLGVEPSGCWREFGRVVLRLPLLELRLGPGGALLAVNLAPAGDADGAQAAARALRAVARSAASAHATRPPRGDGGSKTGAGLTLDRASDAGDREAWRRSIDRIADEIAAGRLRKAVLARAARLPVRTSPLDLLAGANSQPSPAYRFYIQPSAEAAFVGATPELLYRRSGRAIESEALAGTRPRGAGAEEDERLGRELLSSGKDVEEHALVRDHIFERLGPLCDGGLGSDEVSQLLRLTDVQHLRCRLAGRLRDGVDDDAVLSALHPTPAVCGTPAEEALSLLRRLEGFDRGLYGGIVGLLGRDEAECAVAIRGGLALEDELRLFAGSGIVAGSDPDAEWEETELKLRAVAAILGASDAGPA